MLGFKNRSIRLNLVKDEDVIENRMTWSWTPGNYEDVAATVAKCTTGVLLAYIGADTLRKVIIYATSAKI